MSYRILCREDYERLKVNRCASLIHLGFLSTCTDEELLKAITSFQIKNHLPRGNFNYKTLKFLGIEINKFYVRKLGNPTPAASNPPSTQMICPLT